jgi:hypothetical protein
MTDIDLISQEGVYQVSLRLKPGDKCFEYNHKTKQIKQIRVVAGRIKMKLNYGYTVARTKKQALTKIVPKKKPMKSPDR